MYKHRSAHAQTAGTLTTSLKMEKLFAFFSTYSCAGLGLVYQEIPVICSTIEIASECY